ncbi:hypothetical protein ACNPNQ_03100, partial [Serratia odorifera]
MQKSLNASPGFLLKYGGEGGGDSLRSPYGQPAAVQNAMRFVEPSRGFSPLSVRWGIKQKSLNASPGFLLKYGGEG